MILFIAEPSQILRARVINLLAGVQGVEIAGTARTVSEALNGISRLRPDVVLLAFQMYASCSIDLLELMRASRPDVRVILLSNKRLPLPQARHSCPTNGADFHVDVSSDLGKITEILHELNEP